MLYIASANCKTRGCFFSDTLINDLLFGRRGAIFASATLILSFAVGGAFVQNWKQFLACRFLLGIGMGCKAAVVPVFAAEIAPPHLRGMTPAQYLYPLGLTVQVRLS
jgi:MFS family permease